jgi:hypothetical protein
MSKYQYDNKHLPFGHSAAVNDVNVLNAMQNISLDQFSNIDINKQFCQTYLDWIKQHPHNTTGLDNFKYAVYSHGTSESFDKFYMKNLNRRFRIFRSEYLYHQLAWRNSKLNWDYIEDGKLDGNDAVIISYPFADTGNKHEQMDFILHNCSALNIPVLIDCAYYTISSELDFDFNHKCITDITFSLSKTFPVAHARIGMRLTKEDDDDTLFVYEKANYQNRLGAILGLELINNFSSDYIVNKYRTTQIKFCKITNTKPSATVLFGIGGDEWIDYNRGSNTNRLSFHNYLNKGVLDGSTIKQ